MSSALGLLGFIVNRPAPVGCVEPFTFHAGAKESDGDPESCKDSKERIPHHKTGRHTVAKQVWDRLEELANRCNDPDRGRQQQTASSSNRHGREHPGHERHERSAGLDEPEPLVEETE